MGKYSPRNVPEKPKRKDATETFAWRGIGCLLMIITPGLSIIGALVTLESSLRGSLPPELLAGPIFPNSWYITPTISDMLNWVSGIPDLYAVVLISVVYTIVFGALISSVYAAVYRAINPKRYGPTDAPPPNVKAKKYKR